MYCDKCGKEIKPEWRNCPSCGAALHENAVGTDWSNVSGKQYEVVSVCYLCAVISCSDI